MMKMMMMLLLMIIVMMMLMDNDDDDLFCHSWSRKFGWRIQWRWTWRWWWVHGSETLVQTLSFGISLLSLCCLLCKFCYVPNDYLFSSQSICHYLLYLSISIRLGAIVAPTAWGATVDHSKKDQYLAALGSIV